MKTQGSPFLTRIALRDDRAEPGVHPFTLPILANGLALKLTNEPEAALSPQRQLAFLRIVHHLASQRIAQFIIATHSPILLSLPGATVLSFDSGEITSVDYRETEHFTLTRDFLNAPDRFFRHLFADSDDDQRDDR